MMTEDCQENEHAISSLLWHVPRAHSTVGCTATALADPILNL